MKPVLQLCQTSSRSSHTNPSSSFPVPEKHSSFPSKDPRRGDHASPFSLTLLHGVPSYFLPSFSFHLIRKSHCSQQSAHVPTLASLHTCNIFPYKLPLHVCLYPSSLLPSNPCQNHSHHDSPDLNPFPRASLQLTDPTCRLSRQIQPLPSLHMHR